MAADARQPAVPVMAPSPQAHPQMQAQIQAQAQQSLRDQTAVERVHGLYSYLPTTLAGNAAGVSVLALLFWQHAPHGVMAGWMALFWGVWLSRVWMHAVFRRRNPQTLAAVKPWLNAWIAATMGSGVVWGSSAWLFYGHGGTTERIGLLLTVYSFCVAGMPILAPMRRVYNGFAFLCFAPTVLRVGLPAGFDDVVLAGMLLIDHHADHAAGAATTARQLRERVIEAQAASRRSARAVANREGRRPRQARRRGRGGEPRQDAILHRRQPRPAPAAACHGPVRRSACASARRERGGDRTW